MKKRQKRVILSIAVSIAVHLLVLVAAVFLLAFGSVVSSEPAQGEVRNEVVLYFPEIKVEQPPREEPPPEEPVPEEEAQKRQGYLRTGDTNTMEAPPEDAPFSSDKNTFAESPMAPDPDSDMPLPTQEGMKDMPFTELQDREYADGEELNEQARAQAMPAPPPAPVLPPTPLAPKPELIEVERQSELETEAREMAETETRTPADAPVEERGESEEKPSPVAMEARSFADALDLIDTGSPREGDALRDTEGKAEDAPEEAEVSEVEMPQKAAPRVPPAPVPPPLPPVTPAPETMPSTGEEGFIPHTRATQMRGNLTNKGASASARAEATPLGKYKAQVATAVEKLWHRYRQDNADFLVFGSLQLKFKVDRHGNPHHVRVTENDANAIMVDFTLGAVLNASIPPMPEEILDILDNEMLEVTYDVIIY